MSWRGPLRLLPSISYSRARPDYNCAAVTALARELPRSVRWTGVHLQALYLADIYRGAPVIVELPVNPVVRIALHWRAHHSNAAAASSPATVHRHPAHHLYDIREAIVATTLNVVARDIVAASRRTATFKIAHIRYDASGDQSLNSIYSGYGPVPLIMAAQNDLIHAEALARSGGDLTLAATLINQTRVGRGNLAPAAAAGDGAPQLLLYIEYENEVELLSQGASVFWNRRRSPAGLRTGTPREMPVPARELGVKLEPLYTFGGATPQSPLPTP